MDIKKHQNTSGFTIVEMMIVMAVFMFVIGAAVTIFISTVEHQKRILAEQQLLNQVSYAEEYMSKALRMAKAETDETCLDTYTYENGQSSQINSGGYVYLLTRHDDTHDLYRGIKFINQSDDNACQEFFWDTDGVLKEIKNGGNPVALTPPSIKINSVKFSINGSAGSAFTSPSCTLPQQCGASGADVNQPRVTVLLDVQIPGDALQPERMFQTTISQRNLNVQ